MQKKIIVLAAGKGTRMNVDMPKVLFEVNGRPMILYLIENISRLNIKPLVVVGYQAQKVKNCLGQNCEYVLQEEQFGTGHAVACAKDKLKNFQGAILVLYGDMPLVKEKTITKIFELHEKNNSIITMATAEVEDFNDWREGFFYFGRILRNQKNEIVGIKERVDCNKEELKITEINPSYFCFDSQWLWENIHKLQTDNNQKELYLTDLIEIAFDQGIKINSIQINPDECLGVNTMEQLIIVKNLI